MWTRVTIQDVDQAEAETTAMIGAFERLNLEAHCPPHVSVFRAAHTFWFSPAASIVGRTLFEGPNKAIYRSEDKPDLAGFQRLPI
jgi:hypothetical protein